MPKRVLDGEAMWGSTKLSNCPEWAIPWYAWLHPVADANGSFELTNPRVLWCKVAAILPSFTVETLAELVQIYHSHGLLFIWEQDGKRYGHWTGSNRPGRLPRLSRRTERYGPLLAPAVPADELREYELRHQKRRSATAQASLVLEGFRSGMGVGGGKEGAPESGAPAAQARPQPSPLIFSGLHLKVSTSQDELLAEAFPWVDRQADYRKADSWLQANPTRRPRKTAAFIHNWFSRIPAPSNDAKGATNAREYGRDTPKADSLIQLGGRAFGCKAP